MLSIAPAEPDEKVDAATRHRLARFDRDAERAAQIDISREEKVSAERATDSRPNESADVPGAEPKADGAPSGWRERLTQAVAPVTDQIAAIENAPAPAEAPPLEGPSGAGSQPWEPMIEPIEVVRGIARSKLLIATTTLVGALAGVAVALSTPKMYQAWTEMIVDPRNLKLTERELTDSGLPWDATLTLVENQVRVLTSGSVLTKVVDKLDLANDPEFNGGGSGGFGQLMPRGDAPAAPSGPDRRHVLAVDNLFRALTIDRGSKSFVVSIGAKTQNADKSALIANTMTEVFIQTHGEMQAGTAGRATDELNARLEELRKQVEAAERKVESFKAENDLIDAQGRLITDDEIQRVNEQLTGARARTLELNARAATTRSVNVESALSGALPEAVASAAITELRAQYATLTQEADRLSVKLGPRHPERLAVDAQIAGARERIAAELRRVVASIQIELRRAVQTEQELAARLAQLKVRQGEVSNELVTLRELDRDVTAKRAVYESFLLRARETGEQKDINPTNVTIISRASPPLESTGPKRSTIAIAGMLLGFAAGVGLGGMRGAYTSLRTLGDRRSRRRFESVAVAQPGLLLDNDVATAPQMVEAAQTRPTGVMRHDEHRSTALAPESVSDGERWGEETAPDLRPHAHAAPDLVGSAQRDSQQQHISAAAPRPASQCQIDEISESLREVRKELNLLRERRARRYF